MSNSRRPTERDAVRSGRLGIAAVVICGMLALASPAAASCGGEVEVGVASFDAFHEDLVACIHEAQADTSAEVAKKVAKKALVILSEHEERLTQVVQKITN